MPITAILFPNSIVHSVHYIHAGATHVTLSIIHEPELRPARPSGEGVGETKSRWKSSLYINCDDFLLCSLCAYNACFKNLFCSTESIYIIQYTSVCKLKTFQIFYRNSTNLTLYQIETISKNNLLLNISIIFFILLCQKETI